MTDKLTLSLFSTFPHPTPLSAVESFLNDTSMWFEGNEQFLRRRKDVPRGTLVTLEWTTAGQKTPSKITISMP